MCSDSACWSALKCSDSVLACTKVLRQCAPTVYLSAPRCSDSILEYDEEGFIKVFSNHILKFGQAQLAETQQSTLSKSLPDSAKPVSITPLTNGNSATSTTFSETPTSAETATSTDDATSAENATSPETTTSGEDVTSLPPAKMLPPPSLQLLPPPKLLHRLEIEDLEDELQAEVLALSPPSQKSRMRLLRIMGEYELQREENMARNHVLFKSLGLGPEREIELGFKPKVKRKRASPAVKPKPPPSTRQLRSSKQTLSGQSPDPSATDSTPTPASTPTRDPTPTNDSAATPDLTPTNDSGATAGPTPTTAPSVTASQASPEATEIPADMSWLSVAQETLLDKLDNQAFRLVVGTFVRLEVLYGSDADPVNLSWVGRPGDVKLWIKNYRKPSYRPSLISSSDSFSKQLIAWWSRLVGDLRAPGINGLYSVLICLRWWILEEATEGISTPALENFISEVHQRMLDLIRNEEDNKDDRASRTLKRSREEEEPSGREEEDGAESPRPSKIRKV
ncbi:hypothetical protein EV360DRAFT_84631 [Lentinula raphanica]|nr:hypothetical protein EV360DRAFT_84631 [Lentinula raphanica]